MVSKDVASKCENEIERDVRKSEKFIRFAGDATWKQVRYNKVYQISVEVASTRTNRHKTN